MRAHCNAYPAVRNNGKALNSPAWQRFITAAGGKDNVSTYCARKADQGGPGQGEESVPTPQHGQPDQMQKQQSNGKPTHSAPPAAGNNSPHTAPEAATGHGR